MSARLSLYRLGTRLAAPALPLYLQRRVKAGKEDVARLAERLGQSSLKRPAGTLIWLHAASVGESVMLLPLIERFAALPSIGGILVTTQTITSAQIMAQRLPEIAVHQYAVLDTPRAVSRFLDHWQPDLAIFAESEIWPNMIDALWERHIPLSLINARMSEKSLTGWDNKAGKTLFGRFAKIIPGDDRTAQGLSKITGEDLDNLGNLKMAGLPLGVDEQRLAAAQTAIADRRLWCAASTHAGEEEICLRAHELIRARYPEALLLLVPRHPERGADIAAQIQPEHLARTAGDITPQSQVWLMAEMGILGLAYRLAPVSVIGGSLCEGLSGHNPLEPARLGSAILTGPHISSFADIYARLLGANGAEQVGTAEDIADKVTALWSAGQARRAMCDAAAQFAKSEDRVLDRVWDALLPLIPS